MLPPYLRVRMPEYHAIMTYRMGSDTTAVATDLLLIQTVTKGPGYAHLSRVAVPTPLIAFLPLRLHYTLKFPILCLQVVPIIVNANYYLVSFSTITAVVLPLEQPSISNSRYDGNADVHEDNAMAKSIPRLVFASVLEQSSNRNVSRPSCVKLRMNGKIIRTTFELTAPLMFPKLITIASVTLRL